MAKKRSRYKLYLVSSTLVALGGLGAVVATGTSPSLGLDLEGGLSVILTATSSEQVTSDVLGQTVGIIRNRINDLGVAESEVSVAGDDNILIQLPGVEDERQALEIIGTTAQLTFRQVKNEIDTATREDPVEITEIKDQSVNQEEVVYPSVDDPTLVYRLEPAILTGDAITNAEAVLDTTGGQGWSTSLTFRGDAADTWAEFTGRLACLRDEGEPITSQVAIVLDGQVQSAAGMNPSVECDRGITGGDTQITTGGEAEAKDLALVLRTGALPLTLEQSEVRKVSPTLGRDSLNAGLLAGGIGLALVMLYVLVYYRALGLVVWGGLAVFTASLYALISVLGEAVGLALTLAGIAGIIVSIGITTDSYIVAFERLKDEIRSGKSMRAAADRGMRRAFRTILVADFVTGAAAAILFWLAIGPVKGFALTLGIATGVDVLVAYFFTRSAVNLLARTRFFSESRLIGLKDIVEVGQA